MRYADLKQSAEDRVSLLKVTLEALRKEARWTTRTDLMHTTLRLEGRLEEATAFLDLINRVNILSPEEGVITLTHEEYREMRQEIRELREADRYDPRRC